MTVNSLPLKGAWPVDSFGGMWICKRFRKRRAIDLMRVATAVCS